MVVFLLIFIVFFLLFIVGCVIMFFKDISNLCEIFYEKDDWYDVVVDVCDKWGVFIYVLMVMMY